MTDENQNYAELALRNLELMVATENISAELIAIQAAFNELDGELSMNVVEYEEKFSPLYDKANYLLLDLIKKLRIAKQNGTPTP